MNFLSSKIVYELENIFKQMQHSQTANQAQFKLNELSRRQDFELGLSNFIARSNNKQQILLALVLLQKQDQITNIQTVWALKSLYYQEDRKISDLVFGIIIKIQNIGYGFQLLKCNLYNMGLSSFIKYLDILYQLIHKTQILQHQQIDLLKVTFDQLFKIINQHQEIFLMTYVSLAMFYAKIIKNYQYSTDILDHWNHIQNIIQNNNNGTMECYHHLCQNMIQKQFLTEIINAIIKNIPLNYKSNQFKLLLIQIFKALSSNKSKRYIYLETILQIFYEFNLMVWNESTMLQLMQAINNWNFIQNQYKVINYDVYGDYNIGTSDIQSNRLWQILSDYICVLFERYNGWLSNIYLSNMRKDESLHQIVMVLNVCGLNTQMTNKIIESSIEEIINNLQLISENNQINRNQFQRIMNFIQFLIKYNQRIQLHILANICQILSKITIIEIKFSSLCYGFMENIWQRLAFLDYYQLIHFVQQHLRLLNSNVWGMVLGSYECSLHLCIYLQQAYQLISKSRKEDLIYIQIVNGYKTVVELLKLTKQQKIDIEILKLIIKLSAFLINTGNFEILGERDQLSLLYLGEKMLKHNLFTIQGGILMSACRVKNGINQIDFQRQLQSIYLDQHDFEYIVASYYQLIQYIICSYSPLFKTMDEQIGLNIIYNNPKLMEILFKKIYDWLLNIGNFKIKQLKKSQIWKWLSKKRQRINIIDLNLVNGIFSMIECRD